MNDLTRFPLTGTRSAWYVVLREHTLGYIFPEQPVWMGILAGSIIRGGYHHLNGPIVINLSYHELRPATKEDFTFFSVCWKGHLPD